MVFSLFFLCSWSGHSDFPLTNMLSMNGRWAEHVISCTGRICRAQQTCVSHSEGVDFTEAVGCPNLLPFSLQVHPFQREALQMSRVRKRLLSVQNIGCPQNITHAGQRAEASQGQVGQATGTLEKHDQRWPKEQPKTFPSREANIPQGWNIPPATS